MAGFGIQILGLTELVARMGAAPVGIQSDMRTTMTQALLLVEGTARTLAPKKTGRLASSITSRVSGSGGQLLGEVGPSVRYGLYVETGTRPHWMPPGILPFPVMRAIALRGTRPHPYMAPAFAMHEQRIAGMFAALPARVASRLAGVGK